MKHRIRHIAILSLTFIFSLFVLPAVAQESTISNINANKLWVLIAAAAVFLMQAGFLCLEAGMVRFKNIASVSFKNIVDWAVVCVFFYLVGFGLMFGHSWHGLIGVDMFAFPTLDGIQGGSELGWIFFLFQLAFAGTAATIVSGGMAERTAFIPYILASVIIGLVIYPVFGHWAWGNLFFPGNKPWLASLGYVDFAGSSVVHMVGGITALVGIVKVGPRLGRYDDYGNIQSFEQSNPAMAGLGVLLLWFGWWGFNGGSTLALDNSVGLIIFNTNVAAGAAALTAFFHSYIFQKSADISDKFMGGALGGLVAITALPHIVTPLGAIGVGIVAGVAHNYSYDLVIKFMKLDDPVGAVPVHAFCGAVGILSVPIFGRAELLPHTSRITQFAVQSMGLFVCIAWTLLSSLAMFWVIEKLTGLRVSPSQEESGVHISGRETDDDDYTSDVDDRELRELLGALD